VGDVMNGVGLSCFDLVHWALGSNCKVEVFWSSW